MKEYNITDCNEPYRVIREGYGARKESEDKD